MKKKRGVSALLGINVYQGLHRPSRLQLHAATEDDGSCVMQLQEIWQGEQLFSLEEELALAVSGVDHVIWSDNMTENPLTVVESGTYGVTMVNGDLSEMSQSVSTGPGSCGVVEAGDDWKADQFTLGLWLKLDNANRGYILMEGDDGWLDDLVWQFAVHRWVH